MKKIINITKEHLASLEKMLVSLDEETKRVGRFYKTTMEDFDFLPRLVAYDHPDHWQYTCNNLLKPDYELVLLGDSFQTINPVNWYRTKDRPSIGDYVLYLPTISYGDWAIKVSEGIDTNLETTGSLNRRAEYLLSNLSVGDVLEVEEKDFYLFTEVNND